MCSTLEVRLAMLRAAIDEVALAARADRARHTGPPRGAGDTDPGRTDQAGHVGPGGRAGDKDLAGHTDPGRADPANRTGHTDLGRADPGELAEHADPGELARRLAGLWAMMAALDPAVAARLRGYGPDRGLHARTAALCG